MCTQDILAYSCGHSIDMPGIDLCTKAIENNLPRCSDLDEREHPFFDYCPDCDVDRKFEEQMNAVLQKSTNEYHSAQRAMGVTTNDEEEKVVVRRVMDLTSAEMIRRRESEDAKLLEKAIHHSKMEIEQAQEAADAMWRKRPQGYNEQKAGPSHADSDSQPTSILSAAEALTPPTGVLRSLSGLSGGEERTMPPTTLVRERRITTAPTAKSGSGGKGREHVSNQPPSPRTLRVRRMAAFDKIFADDSSSL